MMLKTNNMRLQDLDFNGKVYGRKGNEYIFVDSEKLFVTEEQVSEYFNYLNEAENDKFESGLPNRVETFDAGNGILLNVEYRDGIAYEMEKVGSATHKFKDDADREQSIGYINKQVECGSWVKVSVLSNGIERKQK